MDLEFGNAGLVDTNGTGWFLGFSEWTKSEQSFLRYIPKDYLAKSLCVKWHVCERGDPNGEEKPISEGRSMTILISEFGQFQLDFDRESQFSPSSMESYTLTKQGDFVIWGSGIYHRAFCFDKSVLLTLRWQE